MVPLQRPPRKSKSNPLRWSYICVPSIHFQAKRIDDNYCIQISAATQQSATQIFSKDLRMISTKRGSKKPRNLINEVSKKVSPEGSSSGMLHVRTIMRGTWDLRTWRAREVDRRREDYHRSRWTEEPVVDTALPDPDRLANWQSPWTVRGTGHPTSAVNKASVGGTKLLCILFF